LSVFVNTGNCLLLTDNAHHLKSVGVSVSNNKFFRYLVATENKFRKCLHLELL
jgi:hypothetical protein